MKKHLLMLLGFFIVNGLLAGDGGYRKMSIVRASQPAQPIPSADKRIIGYAINGAIVKKGMPSTAAIIEKRSDDESRLTDPALPLQKE